MTIFTNIHLTFNILDNIGPLGGNVIFSRLTFYLPKIAPTISVVDNHTARAITTINMEIRAILLGPFTTPAFPLFCYVMKSYTNSNLNLILSIAEGTQLM